MIDRLASLSFLIVLLLWGSSGYAKALQVTVSIPPQKYFVTQIAGDHVAVNVMVSSSSDPHTYEPRPQQMLALGASRLYFSIGVEFETLWLKRFQKMYPQMNIVDTSAEISKRKLPLPPYSNKKSSEMEDSHVWLSPLQVKHQASAIYDALLEADPENRAFYQKNYERFLKKLELLHEKLGKILAPVQGHKFVVFHPVWGYFAQDYDLQQIPIELEEKPLKPSQLQKVIESIKSYRVRTIFTQPLLPLRSVKTIAQATGSSLIELNPMSPDWSKNLEYAAHQIASAR